MRFALFCLILLITASSAHAQPARWSIGLLPVAAAPGHDDPASRALWEAELLAALAALPDVEVVDRTELDRAVAELALAKVQPNELATGLIVGAQVMVSATLDAKDDRQAVWLRAVETATGRVLVQRQVGVDKSGEATAAFARDLHAVLPGHDDAVDVAILPVRNSGHLSDRSPLGPAMAAALARSLRDQPKLRVLDRELGELLLTEPRLRAAGLMAARERVVPGAALLSIDGELIHTLADGQPLSEMNLELKLRIRRGEQERRITLTGTMQAIAELEARATQAATQTLAELARIDLPPRDTTDEAAARFWEAQTYLAELQALYDPLKGDQPHAQRMIELAVRAAALLPEDASWYEAIRYYMEGVRYAMPDTPSDDPVVLLRRHFIDAFPTHRRWLHAVETELWYLGISRVGLAEMTPETRRRVIALAEDIEQRVLTGQARGIEINTIFRPAQVLLQMDEDERALAVVSAGTRHHLKSSPEGYAWMLPQGLALHAIQMGKFDVAWRAAELHMDLFPDRPIDKLDIPFEKDGPTPLQMLADAGQLPRWSDLLEHSTELRDRDAALKAKRKLPAFPDFFSPARIEPASIATLPANSGSIVASVMTDAGLVLLSLEIPASRLRLWRLGDEQAIVIEGLPHLVPVGFISGKPIRPSMVWFDGAILLAAGEQGLYRVDAATGKATPASDGLPAGAVHDVKLSGDALWVAGGTEKDGFIARRTDAQPWRIWRAPAGQGAVDRIAFDERWITAIHDRARRFSRFDLESSAWQVIDANAGINLNTELLICHEQLVLRKTFGLAYDESALLVLRILQHGDANAGRLRYPPDGRRSKDEQRWFLDDLIGARQHWDTRVHHLPLDAFVPLRGRPADAITHRGHFWILDVGGNLIATDDFARFAGPFSVADRGLLLQTDDRLLYVIDAQHVVSVPWAAIETQLDQPEIWRTSQEIYDHVRAALDQWLADLPDHDRAWYLWSIRRYDLLDNTPPAAANPPSKP